MYNKNFNSIFCWSSGSSTIYDMSGTSRGSYALTSNNMGGQNTSCHYGGAGNNYYHVVIGAGDTPPTNEDYTLADQSIMASDKMRSEYQSVSVSRANGVVINTQWYNNSNAPIVVKEIGLAYKSGNQLYNPSVNFLVGRQVLSTPVTIQPEETYVFSYRVSVV